MPAPTLITYDVFIANVQEADLRALTTLSTGDTIKTMDPAEADAYQVQGIRLYDAGLLTRFRRSIEVIGGETWQVFDGRLHPQAIPYVAQCAMERVMLSRNPVIE